MSIDQNSVVDYLHQKKMKATIGSRRSLWTILFTGTYTGTGAQNTQLLTELRRIDAIATLSHVGPTEISPGDDVECRANGPGPMSIKNALTGTVQTANNGRFTLGAITRPGVYPFLIDDGVSFSSLTIFAKQVGGDLQLARVSTNGEWRSAPPPVVEVPGLFSRFLATLEALFTGPNSIGVRFLKETAGEQSISLMMDSLLITIGLFPGLQAVTVKVGSQAILDFTAGFMEKVIEELQFHGYSQAERDHLKLVLVIIPKLAKVGISVVNTQKTDPQMCKFVETMSSSIDTVNLSSDFKFQNKNFNVAMGLLWDATTKSVGLVCDIKLKP